MNVIQGVSEIYQRAERVGYTEAAHRARLKELLWQKGYRGVGLYPNNRFSEMIIREYQRSFGDPDFEWILFNSDETVWGTVDGGRIVYGPADILKLNPDIIIVCTYRFDQEICDDLRPYEAQGVVVEKLHREDEVPWIF